MERAPVAVAVAVAVTDVDGAVPSNRGEVGADVDRGSNMVEDKSGEMDASKGVSR